MMSPQEALRDERIASYGDPILAWLEQGSDRFRKTNQVLLLLVTTLFLVASLLLTGCAAVGPDYKRPHIEVAEFFPKIGLTALFGRASPELSAFTSGAANLWSAAATLAGPIFEGGRLEGEYGQAIAEWETAKLRYQQTVLTAFQEVANALITRQKLEEVWAKQARVVGG